MNDIKIGIIGLGYVGLPLAVEFAKKYHTIGYDINLKRIDDLNKNIDITGEVVSKDLKRVLEKKVNGLKIVNNQKELKNCNVYIITVPTPVDKYNNPDLTPLAKATETVAKLLDKDNYIIYESTVYPGATEEFCVPIIEKLTKFKLNKQFFCGYSPERINPGDKLHTITKIKKITSGSNLKSSKFIDSLYSSIIEAGTYNASSIKVAEAAKVIENCQRDINIAFVNELSKIFNLLKIDTNDVLDAAASKWNFLNFRPGLVGGHCIGVDPYYLSKKSKELGYYPEIILSGRRINDSMGKYVAKSVVKKMIKNNINIKNSNVLLLGFTFKENCPDTRNTKVIDIYNELIDYEVNVDVYDPYLKIKDIRDSYNINPYNKIEKIKIKYDSIILCVPHNLFKDLKINQLVKEKHVIYDVKNFLPRNNNIDRL